VDLLYGARAWEVLLSRWDSLPPELDGSGPMRSTAEGAGDEESAAGSSSSASSASSGRGRGRGSVQLLYVHCGGLEGTSSQLNRYKHAGLVASHETM
jgi:hypothetical protein